MPSSDLELQKNALNTETRIATYSIKVRKAMLTGIPNTRNNTTKDGIFHNVRKYIFRVAYVVQATPKQSLRVADRTKMTVKCTKKNPLMRSVQSIVFNCQICKSPY